MSAEPKLHTGRAIFHAASDLVAQAERAIVGNLPEPVRMILTGGTAMALYSPTRSSNNVDAIFSRRILLPEASLPYVDENGKKHVLSWGRSYSPVLGLMHPDAEESAIFVADSPNKKIRILVLSPIDLAVSKLSRYGDNDRQDIKDLYASNIVTPNALEARALDAIGYYIGDVSQVYENLAAALRESVFHE